MKKHRISNCSPSVAARGVVGYAAILSLLFAIGCGNQVTDPPSGKLGPFSAWSQPMHLPAPVNTAAGDEQAPFISKDGLSLYFACATCGGLGNNDIYVSRRSSITEPWGPPQNLGAPINTSFNDGNPALSADGLRLYFVSNRTGSKGLNDIWVSRWTGSGWDTPENLGDGVNSADNEAGPALFEDAATGKVTLYFTSTKAGSLGSSDLYASTQQPDGTFGPAIPVVELNSAADETSPGIRSDGLEIFFRSTRPGSIPLAGVPSGDLWVATRDSASGSWSNPVNVDPDGLLGINTDKHEGGPALSYDGTTLYFHSAQRAENFGVGCPSASTCFFDLWMATRRKL